MAKDIGIGVIGIGMGLDLLYLNQVPDSRMEVRALCAAHRDKVARVGREHGIPFTTDRYQDLLDRDDLHVIADFSWDHLHAEHIIASLEAGKHVVVTKPMVTSLEDALQVVSLVDRTGLKVLVGETCRFYTSFVALKRLYDDGDLGDLIFGEAHYVHDSRSVFAATPWRIEVPQDVLFGGLCHPVDSLVWLFGEAEEVQAYGTRSGVNPAYPLEDTFIVNIRFASGRLARVMGAYGIVEPPIPMMGLGVYGTRGSAVADFHDFRPTQVRATFDGIDTRPVFRADFPADPKGAYGQGDAVRRYMANFEASLDGREDLALDAREGTRTIAILAAAQQSVRSGGEPVAVRRGF
jgi:predicted dehydrogenase